MKYEFPTWLYHKTEGAKIFNSPEEVESAGEGWFDIPQGPEVVDLESGVSEKTVDEPKSEKKEKATRKKEKGE